MDLVLSCCFFVFLFVNVVAVNFGSLWRSDWIAAVLREDGYIATLGGGISGWVTTPEIWNPKLVVSSSGAFAALTDEGRVYCWGYSNKGGQCPHDLGGGVKSMATTTNAIAALRHDGTVQVWGYIAPNNGKNPPVLADVASIYGARAGIIFFFNNGTVVTWFLHGTYTDYVFRYEGDKGQEVSDITSVVAIHSSWMILRKDGTLRVYGQLESALSKTPALVNAKDVIRVYGGDQAWVILFQNKTIACIGSYTNCGEESMYSSISNVKHVYSTYQAFAALTFTGEVHCFGRQDIGGKCTDITNVTTIVGGSENFAALHSNGTVSCWGKGEAVNTTFTSTLRDVQLIQSTASSYLALHADGSLTAWGEGKWAIPVNLTDIVSIESSVFSFITVSSTGTATMFQKDSTETYTVSNAKHIWGSTVYKARCTFPDTYYLNSLEVPYPTSMPSGQPTTVPTARPTAVPSAMPSSLPTLDTKFDTFSFTRGHGFKLNNQAFTDGEGLHYSGGYLFERLGYGGIYSSTDSARKLYLTIEIYDSGFGPVSAGQFLSFSVNDEEITNEDGSRLICAPKSSATDVGCTGMFVPCLYNLEVTNHISSRFGGSLYIQSVSEGILSSSCPYEGSDILYVRYNLTVVPALTPSPTFMPTEAPTPPYVINGLQLDINKFDVWLLLQISIAMGMFLSGVGTVLCTLRNKSEVVYKHAFAYTAIKLGLLGTELASMIFLIIKLVNYGFPSNAIALGVFRILQTFTGGVVLGSLFGPEEMKRWGALIALLDKDHLAAESKIYSFVSIMCLVDVTFLSFLPWKHSRFAMLSKGFPNKWVWQIASATSMASVLISLCCQIPYLNAAPFSAERDLLSVINIILLCIKVLFFGTEYCFKSEILSAVSSTTAAEEDGNLDDSQIKLDEVVLGAINPLYAPKKRDQENQEKGGEVGVSSNPEGDSSSDVDERVALLSSEIKKVENSLRDENRKLWERIRELTTAPSADVHNTLPAACDPLKDPQLTEECALETDDGSCSKI